EHRLNLVHRDDICAAVWAVFGAAPVVANEIFNVADDGPATKAEIAAWLAAQLGTAPPHFTGAATGERRAATPDRVIANVKLKEMTGWQPRYRTFREGYEKILSS